MHAAAADDFVVVVVDLHVEMLGVNVIVIMVLLVALVVVTGLFSISSFLSLCVGKSRVSILIGDLVNCSFTFSKSNTVENGTAIF